MVATCRIDSEVREQRVSCRHLHLLCRWQSQRLVVMKRLANALYPFVTPPLQRLRSGVLVESLERLEA